LALDLRQAAGTQQTLFRCVVVFGPIELIHRQLAIWDYAKSHLYVIVTQYVDFANLVALYGPPPKVIWIRCRKSVKSIPRKIDTNALRRYCWI
jgi:predicted nuclease of predicted toxin-antitoxin system